MKKNWLFLVLVAMLALTACKPKSVITSSAPQPTATSAVEAAVPTPTDAVIVSSSIPSICTVTTLFATPEPTEAAVLSLFDPISAEDHRLGELDAKVTFLEYSDFQCPYCAAIAPVLEQLQAEYPQDVQVVFRNFPINGHPNALITAQAAEAAALQGKFWDMHDTIFATQQTWSEITPEQTEEMLISMAENLGLDVEQFTADLKSDLIVAKVLADQAKAVEIGIPGTPFLLINGRIYQGQSDLASLQSIVKLLLVEDRQFSSCPELTVDMDREYLATVKTEKGDFVIRLFADKAPTTVNSFIFLSRNGWFDDIIFHRVLPGFAVGEIAECRLYSTGFNHTYRLTTAAGSTYYLRAYRRGWRTLDDIRYELDLLNHLKHKSFPAAQPVPYRDGQYYCAVPAPEGRRYLALFTEARYTRHPSQADLHSAFQDHPLALDHFPTGTLVPAPRLGLGAAQP